MKIGSKQGSIALVLGWRETSVDKGKDIKVMMEEKVSNCRQFGFCEAIDVVGGNGKSTWGAGNNGKTWEVVEVELSNATQKRRC
jgi:hypothetical protein